LAYSQIVGDAQDAQEAMAALDHGTPVTAGAPVDLEAQSQLGHVHAQAGRDAEALAPVHAAAAASSALGWPLVQTRAMEDLGIALEATGDRAGARAACQAIIAR
jgi:Flp pilus assembly protein TadD